VGQFDFFLILCLQLLHFLGFSLGDAKDSLDIKVLFVVIPVIVLFRFVILVELRMGFSYICTPKQLDFVGKKGWFVYLFLHFATRLTALSIFFRFFIFNVQQLFDQLLKLNAFDWKVLGVLVMDVSEEFSDPDFDLFDMGLLR
jgi:hypothetical protein